MDIENKSIKEWLTHLTPKQLIGVAAFFISIALASYYVGSHITSVQLTDQLSAAKQDLKSYKIKWAQLEPHLKIQNRFNLEENIVFPYSRDIPQDSESIDNEFFAIKKIDGLKYTKPTMHEYFETITNSEIPLCLNDFFSLAPVHIWKSGPVYTFSEDAQFKTLYPHIVIQKIGKPRLENKLIDYFSCIYSPSGQCANVSSKEHLQNTVKQLTGVAGRLEELDIVGLYWAYQQYDYLMASVFNNDFDWDSSQIQKTPRTMNATNVFTYKNVKLKEDKSNEEYNEVYVKQQTIMAVVNRHLYYIQIVSPTVDIAQNTEFDAITNNWLSSLRLIDD